MREYRRLLALVELDRSGETIVRRADALARLSGAELILLHVIEPDNSSDGGYPSPSPGQIAASYESEGLRRLRYLAAAQGADADVCRTRYGALSDSVQRFAADWQPDLLIADAANAARLGRGTWDVLVVQTAQRGHGGRRGLLDWLLGWAAPLQNSLRIRL
ncbi:MAG: universal stress protein [Betaproteobacteria bacterium]|nr:universal stress protein [Betaproteobacteria bacterium]